MATVEHEGVPQLERAKMESWLNHLNDPPLLDLGNRQQVAEVVGVFIAATFDAAVEAHRSGITSAAEPEDDVPPGWDNASLLAQMKQSDATFR